MNRINGNIFLDQDIQNYESGRDYLPEVLTSQLSVALAYGLLDIIEIFNDLLARYDEDEANYEAFIRELILENLLCVNDTVSRNPHTKLSNLNIDR